jgi:hypothetical protein
MTKQGRSVNLQPATWEKVRKLADELGLSDSNVIQIAVVRLWEQRDEVTGRKQPPPPGVTNDIDPV